MLFIFGISIIFWTIYNQNSTGLTLWAQKHTDRTVSPTAEKIAGSLGFLQTVSDNPRLVNKVDEYFVDIKDHAAVAEPYGENNVKLVDGNIVDKKTKVVQVMGPDPYFNNVPKNDWPPEWKRKSGQHRIISIYQSIIYYSAYFNSCSAF